MEDRRNAAFTAGLLAMIFLIFTVADLFNGDRLFSETENRLLAAKPEFSVDALFSGEYTSDYEKYVTDQFVGRDKWITIKTLTDVILQKKTINGVYLCRDGYLIEQHLPQAYDGELEEKRLDLLKKLAGEWDVKVMLVPTADTF